MGRRKKQGFIKPKMMSSRVEEEDFVKFETLINLRDGLKLQDFQNLLITQYISGNIYLSGSSFQTKPSM